MKYLRLILITLISGWLFTACDQDVDEHSLKSYTPATADTAGGTWRPVLLPTADAIPVAAPGESSDYATEAEAARQSFLKATPEQKAAAEFWRLGAVLRFNELARELVAKYNLLPETDGKGGYRSPNPNNPQAYPEFPFATPPYSVRAYALLSVAQYDALVTTYHYRYQYRRKPVYQTGTGWTPLFPADGEPDYPSVEATAAAASAGVLTALFPDEKDRIETALNACLESRRTAGLNAESDLTAGKDLGAAMSARVLAYAKTDGMSQAGGNADLWKQLADEAAAHQEAPVWYSLENPQRPPMLPLFGQVKMWLTDDRALFRPTPPPALSSAEYKKALSEVKHYSEHISREEWRIAAYWADGTGTSTPPGHWNAIAADLIVQNRQNPLRAARTFALLNMAMMNACIACWECKYYYYVPRPTQMDGSIKTATGIPNFPSYTSGHASFSGAGSTVLAHLFPAEAQKLNGMGDEASISRLYGAIHYRFDCDAGLASGRACGAFVADYARSDGGE